MAVNAVANLREMFSYFFFFYLFTEHGAVTEPGVISQDTYFSDICQTVETLYAWYSKKCLEQLQLSACESLSLSPWLILYVQHSAAGADDAITRKTPMSLTISTVIKCCIASILEEIKLTRTHSTCLSIY